MSPYGSRTAGSEFATEPLEDAPRGVAARTEAAVGIFVSQIAARLPRFFREDPKDQPAGKGEEAQKQPPRTQDFEIAEPFIQEWRYKITVPAGFRVRQLPEAKQETLGIATLSTKFQRDSDTQVSAELVFAMPKKWFSASEGLQLRDAVVGLGKSLAIAPPGHRGGGHGGVTITVSARRRLETVRERPRCVSSVVRVLPELSAGNA